MGLDPRLCTTVGNCLSHSILICTKKCTALYLYASSVG